jgi:ADP-heptose:LPS heptosyltransferase
LSGARALLSNDSGLMHLAEAVGTPVVAIYGPTSRELGFGPGMELSRVVEAGSLWCRPCSKTGRWCIRPFERRKCLRTISTNSVIAALDEVLAGRSRP